MTLWLPACDPMLTHSPGEDIPVEPAGLRSVLHLALQSRQIQWNGGQQELVRGSVTGSRAMTDGCRQTCGLRTQGSRGGESGGVWL